jgi:long-chain acyl-CoA synthetase
MTGFSWERSYPPGVRWDIEIPNRPLYAILDDAVAAHGPRVAVDFLGKTLTYAELGRLVDRAAAGFRRLGVAQGTRVGLFLPNSPQFIIAFFGVLRAGGIVVNMSPLDAAQELQHKAADSGAEIVVTLDLNALYPQMAKLLGTTGVKRLVVGTLQEMLPFPRNLLFPLVKRAEIARVPRDDSHTTFAALIDNDGRHEAAPVADPADEVAVLQYTGGTTGLAKAAMLTHRNLYAAHCIYSEFCGGDEPSIGLGDDVFLAVLPLFHIFALQVNMLMGLSVGGRLILHPRFEIEAVLKDVAAKKPTVFPGVPAMYQAILNHPESARYDLSSLRLCISGGAPLPLDTLQRFEARTGTRITEGWGMTETSPAGTGNSQRSPYKEGSCGMPQPRIEIRVYDLETCTRAMPTGEKGEICITGPNVMKGYWQRPEATAEAFNADGFFRTGDSGYIDEDGYVFLVDRIKDMLLVSGFNVYPRNIEEAIYQHPDVEEVIVIGIDDAKRGQVPKAFIKLRAGAETLTLDALKDFLEDRIGRHEMVRAMELRDQLPRTPVGKLSKKELYAEEQAKQAAAD